MIGIKTVSDLQHELSCFSGGTPVFATVCPIDGEAQEIKDVYVDGVGVMIEAKEAETKQNAIEEVFELCLSRDWNVSITWQKINDWSIEIFKGHGVHYKKLFYSDGHTDKSDVIAETLKFFTDLNLKEA